MRLASGVVAVLWLQLSACSDEPSQSRDAAGLSGAPWTTLFDGTSLDGWTQLGDANWQITDGAVHADSGTGFLLTRESYGDFDLELEFWVTPDANSGVFIRCADRDEIGAATCYEVNIFDQRPDPSYRTGAIVDVATPMVQIETGNRWNTYVISAHGPRLTVTLNGERTVDVEHDRFAAGPIALQYGAGRVMFRNVKIRSN